MKKWSMALLGILVLALTACEKVVGEGPVVVETRDIADFTGVDLRMNADVYYKQEPNFKVEVHAQDNIQDILITERQGNRLAIRLKNDIRLRRHEPIKIYVSSPELASFRISGSGKIFSNSLVDADNKMEMDISGSGDIEMVDLVAPYLDANISGSGHVKVTTGMLPEEKLRISGSGNIDLGNVQAQKVTTNTSGSGNIRVNVSNELNVSISGSGNVYYKGQPTISASVSGSGKLLPF